ncbi:MAG: hypothetical protein HY720_13340 [Planctomycetes bacterium]|nr:hypothetical protein [Planctomycetota bacterium]
MKTARWFVPAFSFALALALVLTGVARADGEYDLMAGTYRYVSLEKIGEDLARQMNEDRLERGSATPDKGGEGLVVWVVDDASLLKEHGVLAQLFQAIVAAFGTPEGDFGSVSMSLVAFRAESRVLCRPTNQVAELAQAFDELAAATDDSFKNVCQIVRDAAVFFQRQASRVRTRYMVLVSLENGDNEDELEAAVTTLVRTRFKFFCVSREAIVSDPFWSRFPGQAQGVKLDLKGQDAPVEELPWGWTLQNSPSHESAPAGYGIYGLNRLVAATEGRYYLFYPEMPGNSFCQYHMYQGACRLCSGRHGNCQAAYDPTRLKSFAPATDARPRYQARMNQDPFFKLTIGAWEELYDKGLIQSPPPFLLDGRSIVTNEKKRQVKGMAMGVAWSPNQLGEYVSEAKKALPDVERLIQIFDRALADKRIDMEHARAQALAEVFRLHLEALRFNLRQIILFQEHAKQILDAHGDPVPDPWCVNPVTDLPGSQVYVYVENYTLCHGARRLRSVRFLGGEEEKAALERVLERAQKSIDKYRQTPFEVVVRRVGLVYLRIYEVLPAV